MHHEHYRPQDFDIEAVAKAPSGEPTGRCCGDGPGPPDPGGRASPGLRW
jgi:hypothetical protein